MKRIYRVLIFIVCCSGVAWFLKTHFYAESPREVITIYKATPYALKPLRATQGEGVETPMAVPVAEMASAENTKTAGDKSSDAELTPEEETDFLEWLESLEQEPFVNTREMEIEDSKDAKALVQQLTLSEEIQIINEIFPLRERIAAYGGNPAGNGVECPLCYHPDDFYITRDGNSWWCHTCSNDGAHDTFEFVARAEGITRKAAHDRLAKEAGLRE